MHLLLLSFEDAGTDVLLQSSTCLGTPVCHRLMLGQASRANLSHELCSAFHLLSTYSVSGSSVLHHVDAMLEGQYQSSISVVDPSPSQKCTHLAEFVWLWSMRFSHHGRIGTYVVVRKVVGGSPQCRPRRPSRIWRKESVGERK